MQFEVSFQTEVGMANKIKLSSKFKKIKTSAAQTILIARNGSASPEAGGSRQPNPFWQSCQNDKWNLAGIESVPENSRNMHPDLPGPPWLYLKRQNAAGGEFSDTAN